MKILCKVNPKQPQPKWQPAQQVNRVGKYLYKHIDGAYQYKNSSNTCDVWFHMLYEVPPPPDSRYKRVDEELHEIDININITTYQKKVRVNVIEVDPMERTLGFDLYDPDAMEDLERAKQMILDKIHKRVAKAYKDYDFVY